MKPIDQLVKEFEDTNSSETITEIRRRIFTEWETVSKKTQDWFLNNHLSTQSLGRMGNAGDKGIFKFLTNDQWLNLFERYEELGVELPELMLDSLKYAPSLLNDFDNFISGFQYSWDDLYCPMLHLKNKKMVDWAFKQLMVTRWSQHYMKGELANFFSAMLWGATEDTMLRLFKEYLVPSIDDYTLYVFTTLFENSDLVHRLKELEFQNQIVFKITKDPIFLPPAVRKIFLVKGTK